MSDTPSAAPGPVKLTGMAVLGAALGGVAAFPIAVLAFFNWRADSPGAIAWGFWAILLAGIGGGVLFAASRRFPPGPRKCSRRVLAVLGVPVLLGWVGLIVLVVQELMKAKP